MRLRRSVVRGPAAPSAARAGLFLSPTRTAPPSPMRSLAAHQRPGDPAGMEERVDLSPSQRTHPGGRHGRRGPPPVPLPPEVARGARRGEVRPGAGDVVGAARIAPTSPPISPVAAWSATECWLALHLLDLGYFRTGGEQYAEENNSFGIATLLCEHVSLQREAVEFDYPAKSGVAAPW